LARSSVGNKNICHKIRPKGGALPGNLLNRRAS
jgi:hypothetical protein